MRKSIFFWKSLFTLILRTLRIKNQLGILDKAVQRLFISGCPEYLKAIKAKKKEARRVFDNSSQVSYGFMGKSVSSNHNLAAASS